MAGKQSQELRAAKEQLEASLSVFHISFVFNAFHYVKGSFSLKKLLYWHDRYKES